ncbi:MAG: glycosyltransferase family 2 protein [Puniceicoccales bacterium]|nr:glycosyltransferase family 2 protein [Puniceicoccales bacterium]
MTFNPCIIIPCHDHGSMLPAVLSALQKYALPVFIVDDASTVPLPPDLIKKFPAQRISILRHEKNMGKGGAVLTALREADKQGFSHALQIDADGQHDSRVIPEFLALSREIPNALVSGRPIYDDTVPRSRFYSRYLTHAWVWLETLSFSIKDSMCGLRVYPIKETLAILARAKVGLRMEFDIEIMVRFAWRKTPIKFIPVHVSYPKDGISNFRPWRDNFRIARMHTRLVILMLLGMPGRFFCGKKQEDVDAANWARLRERRGLLGMRVLFFVYRFFGRRIFQFFLHPVIAVYWITAGTHRRASEAYLRRLKAFATTRGAPVGKKITSYRHFLRFGENMLEKLAAWRGEIPKNSVEIVMSENVREHLQSGKGGIALCAHLGNFELCRALATMDGFVINAVFFQENTRRFARLLEEFAARSQLRILSITEFTPATAVMLQEKIRAGEWVAIAADRVSADSPDRVVNVPFLGMEAPFPQGPFLLAASLRVPVFTMFALREDDGRKIYLEEFANPLEIPRANRLDSLRAAAQKFVEKLEFHTLRAPLEWANFFDFWKEGISEKFPHENRE